MSTGLAPRWAETEERAVEPGAFAIFVPAVEDRDLASLAVRLGDCAESVHAALLDAAAARTGRP